jgi:hypothetical protein
MFPLQGESNSGDPPSYFTCLFEAMIESWRRRWRIGDFAFLFVQLGAQDSSVWPNDYVLAARLAQVWCESKTRHNALCVGVPVLLVVFPRTTFRYLRLPHSLPAHLAAPTRLAWLPRMTSGTWARLTLQPTSITVTRLR